MSDCFDPDLTETEVREGLSTKEFKKIGEGYSAHIFGATDMSVVIKVFPPLNIGSPQDIIFIKKNPIFRYAEGITTRWQKFRIIKWIRQKAKFIIAVFCNTSNAQINKHEGEINIRGYETCIHKGLMKNLPTRLISNCLTQLTVKMGKSLQSYYEKPEKIVLQKMFPKDLLLINKLSHIAHTGDVSTCYKLIGDAINYQIFLWRNGVADTDMSFNIFDNLIMLPNGTLQLHDANDITDSKSAALWFIREKEKDVSNIFMEIERGGYSKLFNRFHDSGISETARKLYGILPKQSREDLILYFLDLSRELFREDHLTEHWAKVKMNLT